MEKKSRASFGDDDIMSTFVIPDIHINILYLYAAFGKKVISFISSCCHVKNNGGSGSLMEGANYGRGDLHLDCLDCSELKLNCTGSMFGSVYACLVQASFFSLSLLIRLRDFFTSLR